MKALTLKVDKQSLEVSDVQTRVVLQNKMLEAQNDKLVKGEQENQKASHFKIFHFLAFNCYMSKNGGKIQIL